MNKITMAFDCMSGTSGPKVSFEGAMLALSQIPELHIKIFGDKDILKGFDSSFKGKLLGSYEIVHAPKVIEDKDDPIKALKSSKGSSMRAAIESVKKKESDAIVSSGNTGALMVMAKLLLRELAEVKRPAITGVFPSPNGGTVVLDLGANAESKPSYLAQWALMGSFYATVVLKKNNPSVGLLNIGKEEIKGTGLQKGAYKIFSKLPINFKGYAEGFDILNGDFDVIVTDGFTGNVLLKTAEGVAKLFFSTLKSGFKKNFFSRIGAIFAGKSIKKVFNELSPEKLNGAMFMGLNGIVVKSHGSSSALGIASAISVTYELARQDINTKLIKELKILEGAEKGVLSKIIERFTK